MWLTYKQVVKEYLEKDFEFLERAFNEPKYLEDITGLTAMKEAETDFDIEWDISDDEDEAAPSDNKEKGALDDF